MTTTSINQPWAISDDFRSRYGNTWADLDFVCAPKISAENFKTDPMNTSMGDLHIANQHIPMRYKDLLSYAKMLDTLSINLYAEKLNKAVTVEVSIKGRTFQLNKTEIGKLATTLQDAVNTSMRAYELGLFI